MKTYLIHLVMVLLLTGCTAGRAPVAMETQTTEATDGIQQATRSTTINSQNSDNVISAETRMESEVERSTGKPAENPALENPSTVRPARVAEPPSTPR